MILVLAIVSCVAASAARLALGDHAPLVPWVGLAWTILFARHSRRGAFALTAVLCGTVEGMLMPAPWTFWPVAYVLAGSLAFATRRLLPVRGGPGEIVMGTLLAGLVRLAAIPFPPFFLPAVAPAVLASLIGIVLTGLSGAVLLSAARSSTTLRMQLERVR